jgi:alpha-beta hydrolase superfamily lysophospholipase
MSGSGVSVLRIASDSRFRRLVDTQIDVQERIIHGYRRVFRVAGTGPPLLLIHGIGDNSHTWEEIMPTLARNHLVIAPDLLGHGESDKPRADYSVAAYANGAPNVWCWYRVVARDAGSRRFCARPRCPALGSPSPRYEFPARRPR